MLAALRALSDLEDAGRLSSSSSSSSSSTSSNNNNNKNNNNNDSSSNSNSSSSSSSTGNGSGNGNLNGDGFIPPEARYRYVSSEWDFQRREVSAVFIPVMSMTAESAAATTVRVPIRF